MVSLRICSWTIRELAAGTSPAIETTDGAQLHKLSPACTIQEKDLQIFTEKVRTAEDDNKDY